MASKQAQQRWRDRTRKGLIKKSLICPVCGKKVRADSSRAPYHFKCWRTTDEGKKFLAEKKRNSRKK